MFVGDEHSAAYALYRPTYPQELYDAIYAAAFPNRQPPFNDLTVADIATGSGQALGPMPRDFGRCVAIDVSPSQLSSLPPQLASCVEARQGDAHATGLQAGSVDLVTVGQALHWFRLDEFFLETRRILKPNGCFAAWTYDFGKLYGFTGAQELYYELHDGQLGPYWAAGRKLVDRNYEDIQPAPKHFEREQRVELPLPGTFTLDQLVGQVRSWSAYRAYLKQNPTLPDPAETFKAEAARRMAAEGSSSLVLARRLTVLLAMAPKAL